MANHHCCVFICILLCREGADSRIVRFMPKRDTQDYLQDLREAESVRETVKILLEEGVRMECFLRPGTEEILCHTTGNIALSDDLTVLDTYSNIPSGQEWAVFSHWTTADAIESIIEEGFVVSEETIHNDLEHTGGTPRCGSVFAWPTESLTRNPPPPASRKNHTLFFVAPPSQVWVAPWRSFSLIRVSNSSDIQKKDRITPREYTENHTISYYDYVTTIEELVSAGQKEARKVHSDLLPYQFS